MSYLALYRKWRPGEFEELIGQPHITRTLENALKDGRISHAYLFCGPRGTGKTSAAKILAKALNCEKGPAPRPCNQCPVCQGINRGTVMDVLEIDAASNRGIDEIRELRSKVRYGSTEGRFKIYIIDEVHMLTQEAFNALLKTLEEPPQGVVFILATTEPHKLPSTILSRCQRFDFHRIGISALVEGLSRIASQEGVEIEEEAIKLIARSSEGGMRDALGLLEQVISFSDGPVKLEGAKEVLGMEEEEVFISLGEAVINNDLISALRGVQKVVDRGRDMSQFLKDITNYFRGLMLLRIQGEETLDIPWASLDSMKEQARSFSQEGLLAVNEVLTEAVYQLRGSSQPRFVLETAVFQICHMDYRLNIKELEKKVERLEKQLLQREGEGYHPPGENGEKEKEKEKEEGNGYQGSPGWKEEESLQEFPEMPEDSGISKNSKSPEPLEPSELTEPSNPPEHLGSSEPLELPDYPEPPEFQEITERANTREPSENKGSWQAPESKAEEGEKISDTEDSVREETLSLEKIQRGWGKILKSLSRSKVVTCSWLEKSTPLSLKDKFLTIEVKNSVAQSILEKGEHQNNIKEAIRLLTGEEVSLKFVVEDKDKEKREKDLQEESFEEGGIDYPPPGETGVERDGDFNNLNISNKNKNMLDFNDREDNRDGEGLIEEALEMFEGKIMEENEYESKKGGFFNEGEHGKNDETGAKNAGGHG